MHFFAVVLFIVFGVFLLCVGLWHERIWWNRRSWRKARGTIVGYTESHNDGVSYHPEIEYEWESGLVKFVSEYGSNYKPQMGERVDILVSPLGEAAEQISVSNRVVFTAVPILLGIICIVVGVSVKPSEIEEHDGSPSETPVPKTKSKD